MTVIVTFENESGKTRYTARARHWTIADREARILTLPARHCELL
jgi:hypothetical protein